MIRIRKAVRFLIVAVFAYRAVCRMGRRARCAASVTTLSRISARSVRWKPYSVAGLSSRACSSALRLSRSLRLCLGRRFADWACPVAPLSDLLRGKKAHEKDECERTQAAHRVLERWSDTNAAQAEKHKPFRSRVDGRHVVLAGSLASAAVCGFPVFCLVAPLV